MTNFTGKRVEHAAALRSPAAPSAVFPLLCPVREAEWVPGWRYRLMYSASGVAELGCCFTTPEDDGAETTWMCTEYEPTRRIAYVWVRPEVVACRLWFGTAGANGGTEIEVKYSYTGLSEAGNAELARYDGAWFGTKMQRLEAALNHYLETGKCIGAWE